MVDRLAAGPAPAPCTAACRRRTPLWVRLASSTARARPKSVILTRSTPFSSRMFDGLMSRWTRPCAWAAARPLAACMPIRRTSLDRSGPSRSIRSWSDRPGM